MSEERRDNRLHLSDLSITGFRGIASLSIKQLGRVTLIAGKNSVGKTSVLDAVRVYAARGQYNSLSKILETRDEFVTATDEDGDRIPAADIAALFHGRDLSSSDRISIGPKGGERQLMINEASLSEDQAAFIEKRFPDLVVDDQFKALKVVFGNSEQLIPAFLHTKGSVRSRTAYRYVQQMSLFGEDEAPSQIGCESLGPGLLDKHEIARYWDTIALTDEEDRAMQALKLILGSDVDRVAVVGDERPRYRRYGRRAVVKLQSQARPVPLISLGDGAMRLFGVALALANSRDGFLLIDEAENGIHHSVQGDFWRMVLETADDNNVQVLATTHSYDCVRGFARAADECNGIEGVLVRLERNDSEMWAVEYSEDDLRVVADQRIEVR